MDDAVERVGLLEIQGVLRTVWALGASPCALLELRRVTDLPRAVLDMVHLKAWA
ncbi:MAG: hypothetical protein ABWU16_00470 [Halothiobacillaceae bacterium]